MRWRSGRSRFKHTMRLFSSTSILLPKTTCDVSVVGQESRNLCEAHEWKALWIARGGLDEELVAPAIEGVKTLGVVNVINKDAAVCTTIEGNPQRLKTLLASGVPQLIFVSINCITQSGLILSYLHRHQTIIDKNLLGQEVRTDRRLVTGAEFLVDLFASSDIVHIKPMMRLADGAAYIHIGSSNSSFPHRCRRG